MPQLSNDIVTTGRLWAGTTDSKIVDVEQVDGFSTAVNTSMSNALKLVKIDYAVASTNVRLEFDKEYTSLAWGTEIPVTTDLLPYLWQRTTYYKWNNTLDVKFLCLEHLVSNCESPIEVEVISKKGNIYINRDINATLEAKVFQNNIDITDEFPDEAFSWYKYDQDGNEINLNIIGKSLTIGSLSVDRKATFSCNVNLDKRNN